ncbi:MAG: ankyrin repeat protein, partial [Maribacter sp.]
MGKHFRNSPKFLYLKLMDNTADFFDEIRNGNLPKIKTFIVTEPHLIHARDSRGSTPLILASYYNFLEITDFLLESGAVVDEKDGTG